MATKAKNKQSLDNTKEKQTAKTAVKPKTGLPAWLMPAIGGITFLLAIGTILFLLISGETPDDANQPDAQPDSKSAVDNVADNVGGQKQKARARQVKNLPAKNSPATQTKSMIRTDTSGSNNAKIADATDARTMTAMSDARTDGSGMGDGVGDQKNQRPEVSPQSAMRQNASAKTESDTPLWRTYARTPNKLALTTGMPRIALIVAGVGINKTYTKYALDNLDNNVTIAISSYSDDINQLIEKARAKGHEILVELPVEPRNFPDFDPGPDTLLTTLMPEQNITRLDRHIGKVKEIVGVLIKGGDKFLADDSASKPVVTELARRQLLYVEDGTAVQSIVTSGSKLKLRIDLVLDRNRERDSIRDSLKLLETIASKTGSASGIFSPNPMTIAIIEDWLANAARKGYAVTPLTTLIAK